MSAKVISILAAGALSAGVLLAPAAASAAPSCTAWGSLPSHVSLGNKPVTVHMTLHGTAGCHAGGGNNGGSATLHRPGARDPQRWAHFGSQDTQTFQLRVDKLGTYTLSHGDVQVYNSREQLVPVHWRSTSVVVERR